MRASPEQYKRDNAGSLLRVMCLKTKTGSCCRKLGARGMCYQLLLHYSMARGSMVENLAKGLPGAMGFMLVGFIGK